MVLGLSKNCFSRKQISVHHEYPNWAGILVVPIPDHKLGFIISKDLQFFYVTFMHRTHMNLVLVGWIVKKFKSSKYFLTNYPLKFLFTFSTISLFWLFAFYPRQWSHPKLVEHKSLIISRIWGYDISLRATDYAYLKLTAIRYLLVLAKGYEIDG